MVTSVPRLRLALLVALLTLGPVHGEARGADEGTPPGEQDPSRMHGDMDEEMPRAPEATHVTAPTRVKMAEGMSQHVLIDVMMNDRGPFRMILDTGAATTVLDSDLVHELGLKSLGTTRIGDPSNPTANEADMLQIGSIEVGSARFEGVDAVGWRGPSLVAMLGARGVLGLPTFRNCLLTIDYPKREVEIAPGTLPEPDGKEILPLTVRPIAEIQVEVAGRKASAHLDIGNSSSLIVPGSWTDDLRTKGEVRQGAGMRASGPAKFSIATLDGDLTIGEYVFHDPEVRFDSGLPHVNVGYGLLRGFALTLDQRNGRIRLVGSPVRDAAGTPSAGPQAPADGRRRIGAALGIRPDGLADVRMVAPDSPAEAAGLEVGDVVTRIDGKPVTTDALASALGGTAPIKLDVRRGDKELAVIVFGDEPKSE